MGCFCLVLLAGYTPPTARALSANRRDPLSYNPAQTKSDY